MGFFQLKWNSARTKKSCWPHLIRRKFEAFKVNKIFYYDVPRAISHHEDFVSVPGTLNINGRNEDYSRISFTFGLINATTVNFNSPYLCPLTYQPNQTLYISSLWASEHLKRFYFFPAAGKLVLQKSLFRIIPEFSKMIQIFRNVQPVPKDDFIILHERGFYLNR